VKLELDDLFRCPALGRELAVKHCLRRQDERRGEVPVRAECQGCAIGAANRAACGKLPAEPAPAEGPLLPRRPLPPTHLWAGDVPDVPIGRAPGAPPPAPRIGLATPAEPVHSRPVRSAWGVELVVDPVPAPHPEVEERAHPRVVHSETAAAQVSGSPGGLVPAPPAEVVHLEVQEVTMPCSGCDSKDHNVRTCPNRKPSSAAAAVAREAQPRPPRAKRQGFSVLDEVQELQLRARDRLNEIDLEVTEYQEAIRALADEAGQLRKFLGMDAQPGRAVG
jgi:hypothetical protein